MTFVLVAFVLLAATGLLVRFCISRLAEARDVLDGLSAQNWLETSRELSCVVVELNEHISNNQAAWAD